MSNPNQPGGPPPAGPPQGPAGPPQGPAGPPQGPAGPPQGPAGPPQGYGGPPQGYGGPPQGYGGPPQGYGGPPQGYGGPPQGFAPAGPYGAAPPYGGLPGAYREYEFTEQENATIRKCALAAKILAGIKFLDAASGLANLNVVQIGLGIVFGITYWGAGTALTNVATTQGRDMFNMMTAVDKLSTAFAIRIWTVIIVAIVALLGFLFFFFVMASASRSF